MGRRPLPRLRCHDDSVAPPQETMKQLTWLAAERRLCDGDSEDDPSSQEDEDEEDDEAKGEEPAEGRSFQTSLDKHVPSGDKTPRGRRSSGRGRGETVRRDDCAGRDDSTSSSAMLSLSPFVLRPQPSAARLGEDASQ